MTDYAVYDVFTDTLFEGNQLAVVLDATKLNDADLQKIANQFNYTETVFVYPPKDPSHTALLRMFTPTKELAFAGHPIIGAAIALSDIGYPDDMILEGLAAPTPTTITNDRVKSASFRIDQSIDLIETVSSSLVAKSLSITPQSILTKNHPPHIISLGIPFAIVELEDIYALAKIHINMEAYIEMNGQHRPHFSDRLPTYAYVKTKTGVQARAFDPLSNVMEDAASGHAAATLVGFLSTLAGKPLQVTIAQGLEMGKPSNIKLSTTVKNGEVTSITVGGSAVKVMEGKLTF